MLRINRQLERLRAKPAAVFQASSVSDPRVVELRRRIEWLISAKQKPKKPKPAPNPNGGDLSAGHVSGSLRVIEASFPPEQQHGEVAVAPGSLVQAEVLARWCFDESLSEVDVSRLLYLDTETTGLSGGAGTLAFLIGIGWFDDGCFQVEQLMLDNPSSECEQLERLQARLQSASGIVTYNGRRFDWPLLCNRFVLNRMAPPVIEHHIDLLSPARRIYKRRLASVRLIRMETEVLGFERIDDIDGSEIPARYWAYLRSGDESLIDPILEHNVYDLIALAAMMGEFERQYLGQVSKHAEDALGAAMLAIKTGDVAHGLQLSTALLSSENHEMQTMAALLIAKVHQRQGAYEAAIQVLDVLLAAGCKSAEIHLVLAKLHEHKIKDLARALKHAVFTKAAEGQEAHERRIARLNRRIEN